MPISNCKAMMFILSGNIGIGMLTLPRAIMNAGLIGGTVGLIVIAIVCVYCMNMLVRAANRAIAARSAWQPAVQVMDYAETAEAAFQGAGGNWHAGAIHIRRLINTFICLNQICSNAVYVLFIAQHIRPFIIHYGGSTMELNYRYYILMVLPLLLLLCFVPDLNRLSPFSTLGNLMQLAGTGIIFYYLFHTELKSTSSLPWIGPVNGWPLFFGTAIFAIEGISVIMPIENDMRNRQAMLGCSGVLNTSMYLTVILYVALGFYGYLKYGKDIAPTITLNLPHEEILGQITLCCFSGSIFFSYAIQFHVAMEIIRRNILTQRWNEGWRLNVADYSTIIILNLITFALAATVPWLDLVVALIGAVKMSTLSLMAPAIIDTASNWNDLGPYNYKAVKNGVIFIFGFIGCIAGTVISLQHIFTNYMDDK